MTCCQCDVLRVGEQIVRRRLEDLLVKRKYRVSGNERTGAFQEHQQFGCLVFILNVNMTIVFGRMFRLMEHSPTFGERSPLLY